MQSSTSAPGAPRRAESRGRPLHVASVVIGASLWMTVAGNAALWQRLNALGLLQGPRGWAFALCAAVAIAATLAIILSLLAWRATLKPAVTLLLLATAVASHFMLSYGVLMDYGMLLNAFQTDRSEAAALLNLGLFGSVLLLAAWPAAWLWRQPVAYGRLRRQLWRNPALAAGALAVLALAVLAMFQPLASTMRNHKDLRYMINPLAGVVSAVRVAARPLQRPSLPMEPLGLDARLQPAPAGARPRLLLLVLGETARSDHFSLNGYARPTTPQLQQQAGVLSFVNAWSCGTSTAESVPCMFSDLGRSRYKARNRDREGLLDVLQHAGLAVLWLDNQSGCKGVCDRVPHAAMDQAACPGGACPDEAMLDTLQARIAALDPARRARGVVVVLHQMGSHGPAYYQRSAPGQKRFLPECTRNALQDCSREEVVNAYDNSIVATDRFLGQAIDWLRRNPTGTDNTLLYVSDHGESLGENNLYLHGMPYAIAPDAQKHVPWITWLAPGSAQAAVLSQPCLRAQAAAPVSHDHYFHSVLGLMAVSTEAYKPALDAYAACRSGDPALNASAAQAPPRSAAPGSTTPPRSAPKPADKTSEG
ncbi:MAG: phosphoethanolamine--lipid A transferase [Rubrivivax sp.]|nr:phosphoethanolamine--lipid A transferase [Rubrivivax sp.]